MIGLRGGGRLSTGGGVPEVEPGADGPGEESYNNDGESKPPASDGGGVIGTLSIRVIRSVSSMRRVASWKSSSSKNSGLYAFREY